MKIVSYSRTQTRIVGIDRSQACIHANQQANLCHDPGFRPITTAFWESNLNSSPKHPSILFEFLFLLLQPHNIVISYLGKSLSLLVEERWLAGSNSRGYNSNPKIVEFYAKHFRPVSCSKYEKEEKEAGNGPFR